MRVPFEPHYSFTIPSIHDDTTLDCRIYHPDISQDPTGTNTRDSQWRKRGIVMAHPYAPMGGSYDDRVVGIVVEEMLQAGYIVGTFNFRGAHGSKHKGRTSWSGRPELDDYTSFAACFMHYMNLVNPYPTSDTVFDPAEQSPVRPPVRQASDPLPSHSPLVILGGYSYGSIILKHLPPVLSILQRFSNPLAGSAFDEILLRAHKLADQSNLGWINEARQAERERRNRKHEHKTSVTIGGEETSPGQRRRSREVMRSLDMPRSLDIGHRLRSLSHRGTRAGKSAVSIQQTEIRLAVPDVRYLLISPLTPPISTLATLALGQKLWIRPTDAATSIGKFASMAIYGDQDIFASAKKIRDWSDNLKADHGSRFSSVEVAGAGHFWVEKGAEEQLRNALSGWAHEILSEDDIALASP